MNQGLTPAARNDDREVHAALPEGGLLVRYKRSGKWFVKYPPDLGRKHIPVTLAAGAQLAVGTPGCFVALGCPGENKFRAANHDLLPDTRETSTP